VEKNLRRLGLDAKCYVAMRYWHPFTEEALEEVKRDGVNTLVVIPLYPHFSISTSGSSLRVLQEAFFRDSNTWGGVRHTVVPNWYSRPGYIKAMGKLIKAEIDKFTEEEKAQVGGSMRKDDSWMMMVLPFLSLLSYDSTAPLSFSFRILTIISPYLPSLLPPPHPPTPPSPPPPTITYYYSSCNRGISTCYFQLMVFPSVTSL